MNRLPKHSTETQLPNVYISCMFWLPGEKYLLNMNYSSLRTFYLYHRISGICSAHLFTNFPAEMYFEIKLVGLSVSARTAATNSDFTLTLFLIDGFCFSTRMWHHIVIRKHGRKTELDKGGMNAAFV